MAGDRVVVVTLIFYPDKAGSPPNFCDVLSQVIWSLGLLDMEGNSGSVGIMGVMAILLDVGTEILETTMGTVGEAEDHWKCHEWGTAGIE